MGQSVTKQIVFGKSSSSFFSASPVRSSSETLIPLSSSNFFVSAKVRYFVSGTFSFSFKIFSSSEFFSVTFLTTCWIAFPISSRTSCAEAKAISISIWRHSFRCRTVLCFSARQTGVIVTMFSIEHAIICLYS